MPYKVQNTRRLTPDELTAILCRSAKIYAEYADTTLLFIFRKNMSDAYDYYEVSFGKNNFMHLAGVKNEEMGAVGFFEACVNGTIKREECKPRRTVGTMFSKVAVMEQLLDLRHSKCYKIGEKNLVTRDNDFEMATGNSVGVVGFDSRIKIKGTKRPDRTSASVPTTLLTNPITEYCSTPYKIMFILQKQQGETTYGNVFYEIKKGLFETEKELFSEELKRLI